MAKMKRKDRVVDSMARIFEDYDWLIREFEPCPTCGRRVDFGISYCSNCGLKLKPNLKPLAVEDLEPIWEAFQAGLSEWKKK